MVQGSKRTAKIRELGVERKDLKAGIKDQRPNNKTRTL